MKASRQLHRKATNVLLFALPLVAAGPHKIRQIQSNATSSNTGLEGICTSAHINSLVAGFTALPTVAYFTNATANIATNLTFVPNPNGPDYPFTSGLTYCNVSISFKHNNLNDVITNRFFLPVPSQFKKRWLTLGGGGWSVNGANNLAGGLTYGAATGATDGGFLAGSLTVNDLASGGNGTIAWSRFESFAYQAIHEVTVNGKQLANSFYNLTTGQLKSYYRGCSEGGREGLMLSQRYPDDVDGIVAAAPAIYFPVVQLAQCWPNIAMAQIKYWPSPCAFAQINRDFIAACDSLDGKTDGIVSRSDLCTYNASSSIGKTYSNCTLGGMGAPTNGTVSASDAAVVSAILRGPFDSNNNQIFYTYQPGTLLSVEAAVTWNNASQSFASGNSPFCNTYVQNLVRLNTSAAAFVVDYSNYTVDSIYQLMLQGLQNYGSWSETTWPDLSRWQARGGKIINWHGEADTNLYPQGSAHYYEKVRAHMFPNDTGYGNITQFYRYFLVPGAAHCSISAYTPTGPYPSNALSQMFSWVENGTAPAYLDGTTFTNSSTQSQICMWPSVPTWTNNGTTFSCEAANRSATFIKPLNAWKVDY